ncbi:MAG TPA: signal peptidase I [Symbiobacteriaceae bacterium]|nr:signal peptidase I [Symbiobacteriaceae bacterium]
MFQKMLKVLNILVTAVLLLLILASATLAISARRSKDALPTVGGYKLLTVLSGSMEPSIRTGDAIAVRPVQPGQVAKEGDVITFFAKEGSAMLITHRVIGLIKMNEKPVAYVTKGDNNESQDLTPVPVDRVVGIYQWRIPFFGYVSDFMRKPFGILLFVVLPGLLFIGGELKRVWRAMEETEDSVKDPAPAESPNPATTPGAPEK